MPKEQLRAVTRGLMLGTSAQAAASRCPRSALTKLPVATPRRARAKSGWAVATCGTSRFADARSAVRKTLRGQAAESVYWTYNSYHGLPTGKHG